MEIGILGKAIGHQKHDCQQKQLCGKVSQSIHSNPELKSDRLSPVSYVKQQAGTQSLVEYR